MLSNAYLLAKIGADTAENEQHFAENLPIGRRAAFRRAGAQVLRRGAEAVRGRRRGRGRDPCPRNAMVLSNKRTKPVDLYVVKYADKI